MTEPKLEELIKCIEEVGIHQKYIKDINDNLMSYYLNIKQSCSFQNEQLKKMNKMKQKKITNYFS